MLLLREGADKITNSNEFQHSMKSILRSGLLSIVVMALVFTGCRKEKETIARIKVVKAADGITAVAGANVHLYTEGNGNPHDIRNDIEQETTTNELGEAVFNYTHLFRKGQAGLFVLQVEITKDAHTAIGVVKVVEDESSETTFEIDVP